MKFYFINSFQLNPKYSQTDSDCLSSRRADKKLDSKKLTALERLKKARAGEKVIFRS